jgi:hypothetical protein
MMEKEEKEEEEEEETSLHLPASQTTLKAARQILVLRMGLGGCGQWAASGEVSHTGL